MKANSDKIHLIMNCKEPTTTMIDGLSIDSNKSEVLLGINIDQELKFDEHINYLYKKPRPEAHCSCSYCTFS